MHLHNVGYIVVYSTLVALHILMVIIKICIIYVHMETLHV
jgi:hypothetical protein